MLHELLESLPSTLVIEPPVLIFIDEILHDELLALGACFCPCKTQGSA